MALKASGRGSIPAFHVMDVMRSARERAAAVGDVLHLEVGQPSTGAPAKALAAAKAALDGDKLGYTLALGLEPLRERIARHYADEYGVSVDPEQVVITPGSSGGFILSFLAAFDPGDKVGLACPGYPCYRNILSAFGIEPVLIPVGPETRFQPTVAVLEQLGTALDGLIVASPSNPTGSMLPPEDFHGLVDYCTRRGIRLVSDEIYHGITYGMRAETAAGPGSTAIVVNSFSKYYSMTGWRLGWLVVPRDLLRSVECLAQNLFISAPTLSQHAAVAVFDDKAELDANVARYRANRDLLVSRLPEAGLDRLAPSDGAFYVYADVSRLTNDSPDFCRRLLADTGVAATPGVDFDPQQGHRFMRFSYAGATDHMAEAVRRLKEWRRL